ncbi:MAG: hypothetical protein HeimAB125_16970, partial [Candidatus Heimdallarchaeota archaeon AB_125]
MKENMKLMYAGEDKLESKIVVLG